MFMAAGGPVGAGSVTSSFFNSDSKSRLFSGIFLSRLKFDGFAHRFANTRLILSLLSVK